MEKPKVKPRLEKAAKKNSGKDTPETRPVGRPSSFKPEYMEQMGGLATMLAKLRRLGANDAEVGYFACSNMDGDDLISVCVPLMKMDRTGVFAHRKLIVCARRKASNNPSKRITNATRARIWASVKGKADGGAFSRMKFTRDELIAHLCALFSDGMTMENYGEWHIDHIKPCAAFNMEVESEFNDCWALSNLQPLWAGDNIRKGAKYGTS